MEVRKIKEKILWVLCCSYSLNSIILNSHKINRKA